MLIILLIFFIFLIITVAVALIMLSFLLGITITGGVPFISSSKKIFNNLLTAADLKPGEVIYDLGCGKAHFLIYAARNYGAKGIGYEVSPWPYLWARFNIWRQRADVKVYFKNFFKADLSQADVVFCYLFPEVMAKLESKFKRELNSGVRVISNSFKLPNIKPLKIIQTNKDNINLGRIFVYQF